jgi:serine phosphatase RsbU (regulator of sigma subunit)
VIYTDGLVHAGSRVGRPMDICTSLKAMLEEQDPSPQAIADALLGEALMLDEGRPVDDISVVVLKVLKRRGDAVRRMTVRLPIDFMRS